jgi:hypothetical protein
MGTEVSGRKEPETINQREAEVELGNRIYQAAIYFEELEGKGLIRGNGHHLAQAVAEYAQTLLKERWQR